MTNKRVLIISPHFPPINAPDMQRVRMSLPYYEEFGWDAEVVCVDENFCEGFRDELLNETIPINIIVHRTKAFPVSITRKFGLGSLSIRAFLFFKKKGTAVLKKKKFDLIFFSTSMFHVCALGPYWKKKFNIPFIIDMQDPWRNDYYLSKPTSERPPKFWIFHQLNKYLEAYTMPFVDGIMSVSKGYIETLIQRYPSLLKIPVIVLPFGGSLKDYETVHKKNIQPQLINLKNNKINVVYIGAVTPFFLPLIRAFFIAFRDSNLEKNKYHFYFIGTDYQIGSNRKLVKGLAESLNMEAFITEYPQRIPYFSALSTLLYADILFLPGSLDVDYNASKVYNNILSCKPIFSIFNEKSLVKQAIENSEAGIVIGIEESDSENTIINKIKPLLYEFSNLHTKSKTDLNKVTEFTSQKMTLHQTTFFNQIISKFS